MTNRKMTQVIMTNVNFQPPFWVKRKLKKKTVTASVLRVVHMITRVYCENLTACKLKRLALPLHKSTLNLI